MRLASLELPPQRAVVEHAAMKSAPETGPCRGSALAAGHCPGPRLPVSPSTRSLSSLLCRT